MELHRGCLQIPDHRLRPHGRHRAKQQDPRDRQALDDPQLRQRPIPRRPEHSDAGTRQPNQGREPRRSRQRRQHQELAEKARERRHAGDQQAAADEREAEEGNGGRDRTADQGLLELVQIGLPRRDGLVDEERDRIGVVRIRVLGLEQFELGHDRGASHDSSRILRHSYHTPAYVDLTFDAYEDWADLEDATGESFVTVTGGLDLFPTGAAIPMDDYTLSMDARQVPYELLERGEILFRRAGFDERPTEALRVLQRLLRLIRELTCRARREAALLPLLRALESVEAHMVRCAVCGNVDTVDPCAICADPRRDQRMQLDKEEDAALDEAEEK